MLRKNIILITVLLGIIALSLLPYRHHSLILLPETGSSAAGGFKLITPLFTYFIEPLTGLSDYFQSFKDPKKQIFSWLVWILLILCIDALRRKRLKNLLRAVTGIFIFIVYVTVMVLFVPPKYRITGSNPSALLVDFHSHTSFSHDGFTGPCRSSRWHLKRGFDFFYVTDHGVNKYAKIPEICGASGSIKALPGEEVADKYGTHLLVLGLTEPVPEHLLIAETSEIVSYAHSMGGAVAVAHWWHSKNMPMEELLRSNVDAFEIYGHETTPLDEQTRNDIVEFCRKNSLPVIGGTNWHGWGTRNDLWSIVYIDDWRKMNDAKINKIIIDGLRGKNNTVTFNVLFIDKNEPQTLLRVILEPFVGIFYYFLGLNFFHGVSWCAWLIVLTSIIRNCFYL